MIRDKWYFNGNADHWISSNMHYDMMYALIMDYKLIQKDGSLNPKHVAMIYLLTFDVHKIPMSSWITHVDFGFASDQMIKNISNGIYNKDVKTGLVHSLTLSIWDGEHPEDTYKVVKECVPEYGKLFDQAMEIARMESLTVYDMYSEYADKIMDGLYPNEAIRRNRQTQEAIESGSAKVYNAVDEEGFIRSKDK